MGLFGNLFSSKKQPDAEYEPVTPLFQQSFVQSKSFRGHKRFRVTYYGYKRAEEGLAQFRKADIDLNKADILLRRVNHNDYLFVEVLIDGFFVGSVSELSCNEEQLAFLENELYKGHVDSAHVRIEYETIIGEERGKLVSEEREKIFLFLKAKE